MNGNLANLNFPKPSFAFLYSLGSYSMFEHSTIVASNDQTWADFDDDIVILNFKSGMYYGLNHVGARIWKLVQQPRTVHQLRDAILEQYEVNAAYCEADLLNLLKQLAEHGLVEVSDGPAT